MVVGLMAIAGVGGYAVGAAERRSALERRPALPPPPPIGKPQLRGPGWYVLMYDQVSRDSPKGRLKEYDGPFADEQLAKTIGKGARAGLWRGRSARVEVKYRKKSPF
jgi:hypothetical protein